VRGLRIAVLFMLISANCLLAWTSWSRAAWKLAYETAESQLDTRTTELHALEAEQDGNRALIDNCPPGLLYGCLARAGYDPRPPQSLTVYTILYEPTSSPPPQSPLLLLDALRPGLGDALAKAAAPPSRGAFVPEWVIETQGCPAQILARPAGGEPVVTLDPQLALSREAQR